MTAAAGHVAGEARLDQDNPWPGLAAYDEASHDFYIGRAVEADELQRRILDEPITVLFGKSGLGKTSLLKAGVFPRVRNKGLLPIFIRLQVRPGSEPLTEQVRLSLLAELRAQQVEHPEPGPGEALWEYLHRTGQKFWTTKNRLVRPLFVFDQFEELFTLGRAVPAEVAAFREDLADLAENRIPAALAIRLGDRPAGDLGLDVQAMPYKLVIALREDFLADLEAWRETMPSLRRNRMRLLPMGLDQALQAVCNERTKHLVPEAIAQKIVEFLSSGRAAAGTEGAAQTVEPALLSLFCAGVNEHRKQDGKAQFDEALIEGAKGTIVADFYKVSLADQPERVRQFIEEELITEHGYRNSYSTEDALTRGAVTDDELAALVNRHLLRREHYLGTERVELTHDLLTKAVVEERDSRRRTERAKRERKRFWTSVVVVAVLGLVFGGFAYYAYREGDLARSRELAAVAATRLDEDPDLAILLALEGLRRAPTEEARFALLDAAQHAWPWAAIPNDKLGVSPDAVALTADGDRLAVLTKNDTITVWDVTSREPRPVWEKAVTLEGSSAVAFSPDQTLLAVARRKSIELLGATTDRVARRTVTLDTEVDDRQIVFSPDGGWLVATLDPDALQLLDYRNESAKPRPVKAEGVKGLVGFAVLPGAKRIIAVSDSPLAAYALDQQPNGSWESEKLDLSRCISMQSVSPGPESLSATWKAHTCAFGASFGSRADDPDEFESAGDTVTDDIVWSPAGRAFVQVLLSRDLVVGTDPSGRLASRIKGAHPLWYSELSRFIAVNELATRAAVISSGPEPLVKVYSLDASHKPFLSPLGRDSFAVAPDGSWIAIRRPGSDKGAVIDVMRLGSTTASDPGPSIEIDTSPKALYAAEDSVVLVLPTDPVTTAVFDAATGKRRFTVDGAAAPLGTSGKLLLVGAGVPVRSSTEPLFLATEGSGSWRVVKTRDGTPVSAQDPPPAAGERTILVASPNREVLAVVRAEPAPALGANAVVYSIRGDSLVRAGQVSDLISASTLLVADDASTLTDRYTERVWPVTAKGGPAPAASLLKCEQTTSPLGRFCMDDKTGKLVKRADNSVLEEFKKVSGSRFSEDDRWLAVWRKKRIEIFDLDRGETKRVKGLRQFTDEKSKFRVSSDDRWLAVWGEKKIQIFDLDRGEKAFELNQWISGVDFVARNTLLSLHLTGDTRMLVPLDDKLAEDFATWLVQRPLTAEECELYDLGRESGPCASSASSGQSENP